ncbi:MAG TPA: HAMP domain-containing protein [Chromatiaceae bacterium]|nr:HAMP domain-containing protein [Chromatiaceae bacterium]
MIWFKQSLNHKFALATIAGFLISSVVFLALFIGFYRKELEEEKSQAVREVNQLLQSSLENAMLKRDLDGLIYIVRHLGEQPNIRNVMIANPEGLVRFASDSNLVGRKLAADFVQGTEAHTLFMKNFQDAEVLRSINPVHNKPPCQVCHGPIEGHPINGILFVDYDATSIRQQARDTTLMLMGAGALIVLINLVGGWWFIRRFILKPVAALNAASESLAKGELHARVPSQGNDELSRLGDAFNLMAENLHFRTRQLEEGRAFLQAMVDAIPDGVRIIDEDYNMLLVNRSFREQTRCPERSWVGEKCYRAAHNLDSPCPAELLTCPLEEIRQDAKPLKVVHRHSGCDESTLDVEIYAAPMRITIEGEEKILVVESIRDLSQQVRFTHEQRLSELGRLAAGVAHEIFNPLSSMKLALHSLLQSVNREGQPAEVTNYLAVVEQEMDQCIHITDRLLRLSAAPLEEKELVDMQEVVSDTLSLLKWDAEQSGIELILEFPEEPLRVLASSSEMRMLVLNLIQNAFHAMPEGGQLRISGELINDQVVLKFVDTGVGIPAEDLPYIFMPFFSRRADGVHGTGLGLSISRTIVESCDGKLTVSTEYGKGCCFSVVLPEVSMDALMA